MCNLLGDRCECECCCSVPFFSILLRFILEWNRNQYSFSLTFLKEKEIFTTIFNTHVALLARRFLFSRTAWAPHPPTLDPTVITQDDQSRLGANCIATSFIPLAHFLYVSSPTCLPPPSTRWPYSTRGLFDACIKLFSLTNKQDR